MGKYLDMIRVAERQKAERGAFVASVATPNSHLATTEQPQIDGLQAHLLGDKSDKRRPLDYRTAAFGHICRFGRAPEPQEDTWTDAHEERAAIVEYDGGIPRAWAEGLARLDPNKPPGDVPPRRWLCFIDDCGHFLDAGWAERAAALGWGPLDLFGCDRERPFERIDHLGLLWLRDGGTIVEIRRDRVGALQTYYRRPVEAGRVVLALGACVLKRNAHARIA